MRNMIKLAKFSDVALLFENTDISTYQYKGTHVCPYTFNPMTTFDLDGSTYVTRVEYLFDIGKINSIELQCRPA